MTHHYVRQDVRLFVSQTREVNGISVVKPPSVSLTFRCPDDLYRALLDFALDNGITKSGKPIISEVLVTVLREGLSGDAERPALSPMVPLSDLEHVREEIKELSNILSNNFVRKDALAELENRLFGEKVLSETRDQQAVYIVPELPSPISSAPIISKQEKKLVAEIKQALHAIGFTMNVWRQTGYGVWLIWRDLDERYRSAKIRLYRLNGVWELKRLGGELGGIVPLSKGHEVSRAIAPLLVQLRALEIV